MCSYNLNTSRQEDFSMLSKPLLLRRTVETRNLPFAGITKVRSVSLRAEPSEYQMSPRLRTDTPCSLTLSRGAGNEPHARTRRSKQEFCCKPEPVLSENKGHRVALQSRSEFVRMEKRRRCGNLKSSACVFGALQTSAFIKLLCARILRTHTCNSFLSKHTGMQVL